MGQKKEFNFLTVVICKEELLGKCQTHITGTYYEK